MPAAAFVILFLADAANRPVIDFDTEVIPVLTKAGCNTGACHGAAIGRGGFRLSLYGSRPESYYLAITQELEGRRLNYRRADTSLLLKKPSEMMEHGGGLRLPPDSTGFSIVEQWIAQGASRHRSRQLTSFKFTTTERNTLAIGQKTQLQATATFNDGTERDVLDWTVITPADPETVSIDERGSVAISATGRHLILARFLNRVVPLEIIVPLKQMSLVQGPRSASIIDELVNKRLTMLGLTPEPRTDDAAFLRRLHLDLTGQLPEPSVIEAYLRDTAPNKAEEIIDSLLESEAFTTFQTFRIAQQLKLNSIKADSASTKIYYDWLRERVEHDASWADIVKALLRGEGPINTVAEANFFTVTGDPRQHAEFISQQLLGFRIQCANCHDHPLDSWTQDDYHGLAAIFAGVKRGPVIRFSSGYVIHPATGEPAKPKIPGGEFLPGDEDNRNRLADWLGSPRNKFFSQSMANRIWATLMGRGLVDATDDIRTTNPPTHPELLNLLSKRFISSGYSIRSLYRDICLTDAYARESELKIERNRFPEFYAAAIAKPMSPEVLLDAIAEVTGVPPTIDASRSKAITLRGLSGKSEQLDLLGRCTAEELCNSSSVAGDDLSVQLQLLNGGILNRPIASPQGRLMRSIRKSAGDLITEFYLRSLSRHPSNEELRYWKTQFATQTTETGKAELAQDFLWSLLSSEEFRTIR